MVVRAMMGAKVKRKEDPGLITGAAKFVGDMKLPGMRYVAFVRSPHAHARIVDMDVSAAVARAGVVEVITGRDLVDHYEMLPVASDDDVKHLRSHYALSIDRVRHVGEAVAAVVAVAPEIAVDAVDDVVVEWETLPVFIDPTKALDGESTPIFAGMTTNIGDTWHKIEGDVDKLFADAPHSLSQRMVSQRLAGIPMETRAVLAAPDAVTGGVTVWCSSQTPHGLRTQLSEVLRLPENMIRVIAPNVGGGFGVKAGFYPEEVVLALLAHRRQVPFRWIESRMENLQTTTQGRDQIADVDVAFDVDGRLLALRIHVIADMGAYPSGFFLGELTGMMANGTYDIPAIDFTAHSVYTNKVSIGPYRGAGRPEAIYYIERIIKLVAGHLGMDSADIRRRNYIKPDQFPYKTPIGGTYDSGDYETNLSTALQLSNYDALRSEQQQRRQANSDTLLGIGIASYVEMCGFGPYESAVVRVEPGGTVTVYTGLSPHGQGNATTFAQIVADQIGVDFDKVIVRHSDTGAGPMGIGTFGSRGVVVGGSALMRASGKVREKAMKIAAHILEAAHEDIELENGQYRVKGSPHTGLTLTEIASRAYTSDLPDDVDSGLEATDFFRPPDLVYPFGTHVAVVEIERDTGIITLRDYFSVDDCGPRISPMLVEGQVHGGLAQGIGQALLEEIIYDEQGQLITGSLLDYAMPRADVFPAFVLGETVTPTPLNPLGAKGIGEAATIGSTPAVVNAVMDALAPLGIRHIDMPLTPAKVWKAIHS